MLAKKLLMNAEISHPAVGDDSSGMARRGTMMKAKQIKRLDEKQLTGGVELSLNIEESILNILQEHQATTDDGTRPGLQICNSE